MARTDAAPVTRVGRIAVLVAASVAVVVVAVVAFSVGRLSTLADAPPTDTSAEAGFARDMQVHHQQGVELAMIVRDASDDPDVRLLAYDIATTQAQQSGQLYGWLRSWGLPQAGTEPSMTWMTRPSADAAAATRRTTPTPTRRARRCPGSRRPSRSPPFARRRASTPSAASSSS